MSSHQHHSVLRRALQDSTFPYLSDVISTAHPWAIVGTAGGCLCVLFLLGCCCYFRIFRNRLPANEQPQPQSQPNQSKRTTNNVTAANIRDEENQLGTTAAKNDITKKRKKLLQQMAARDSAPSALAGRRHSHADKHTRVHRHEDDDTTTAAASAAAAADVDDRHIEEEDEEEEEEDDEKSGDEKSVDESGKDSSPSHSHASSSQRSLPPTLTSNPQPQPQQQPQPQSTLLLQPSTPQQLPVAQPQPHSQPISQKSQSSSSSPLPLDSQSLTESDTLQHLLSQTEPILSTPNKSNSSSKSNPSSKSDTPSQTENNPSSQNKNNTPVKTNPSKNATPTSAPIPTSTSTSPAVQPTPSSIKTNTSNGAIPTPASTSTTAQHIPTSTTEQHTPSQTKASPYSTPGGITSTSTPTSPHELEQLLATRRHTLGDQHQQTLSTMNNLAGITHTLSNESLINTPTTHPFIPHRIHTPYYTLA